jgi:hypothetical protein
MRNTDELHLTVGLLLFGGERRGRSGGMPIRMDCLSRLNIRFRMKNRYEATVKNSKARTLLFILFFCVPEVRAKIVIDIYCDFVLRYNILAYAYNVKFIDLN